MKRILIFLLPFVWNFSQAQTVDFGAFAGVTIYSGDLTPDELGVYFTEMHPGGGLFTRVNFSNRFSGRLGINYGRVSGDDLKYERNQGRRLSFRTDIVEVNLIGELNLFTLGNRRAGGSLVIPFLYGGVGLFKFNPQTLDNNQWIDLQPLGTEAQGLPGYDDPYQLVQYNIPLGVGIKFILNDTWTIGLEFGGRKLFTDYLDDVGDTVINYQDLIKGNGELAARLSNPRITDQDADLTYFRGGEFKDWYYFGGLTVAYNITGGATSRGGGGKYGCPTF